MADVASQTTNPVSEDALTSAQPSTNATTASASISSNAQTAHPTPKITLYTNLGCPWAQRAHITLKELDLHYSQVLIDLSRPREPSYLKINPRGLVPSLKFDNGIISEIVTESAIVAQFLADAFPSHLLPASHASPTAPLQRARITYFIDTWFSKVNGLCWDACLALEDKSAKTKAMVDAIATHIEPLLASADPFFGGSSRMTMAECLTGPFVLRVGAYARCGLLDQEAVKGLDGLENYARWAKAVVTQESVTYSFDEAEVMREEVEFVEMKRSGKK